MHAVNTNGLTIHRVEDVSPARSEAHCAAETLRMEPHPSYWNANYRIDWSAAQGAWYPNILDCKYWTLVVGRNVVSLQELFLLRANRGVVLA